MADSQTEESFINPAFRAAEIEARFGAALTAEQSEQVKARIERSLSLASALRSTRLTNADEPEIVFMPYRGQS